MNTDILAFGHPDFTLIFYCVAAILLLSVYPKDLLEKIGISSNIWAAIIVFYVCVIPFLVNFILKLVLKRKMDELDISYYQGTFIGWHLTSCLWLFLIFAVLCWIW